jgi:hypothetical protein
VGSDSDSDSDSNSGEGERDNADNDSEDSEYARRSFSSSSLEMSALSSVMVVELAPQLPTDIPNM